MRGLTKKVLLILGITGSLCFGLQASVFAANELCPLDAPPEVRNSEFCKEQSDPIGGKGGLVSDITDVVSVVAGIVAVVMIMVGGFKFVTSSGDSSKVEEAKKTITWSVIGLVVIVSARAIILFVISRV
ncbi:MAG TPA: pilin [Candidatus Saccharimonadales bacterium]|nr:pilin [Candidatus Saccharimonadales bacterium]